MWQAVTSSCGPSTEAPVDPVPEADMVNSVKARRRVGSMDMEQLPTQRGDLQGGDASLPTKHRMVLVYMPAVLANLGLAEMILASLYGHWWGAFVGSLALAGGSGLLWTQPRKFLSGWGRSLVLFFFSYVALLVLVRLASFQGWQDVVPDSTHVRDIFPQRCPPGKLLGCTRVALSESHPDPQANPPRLQVYLQDAARAVEQWAAQEPRTRILVQRQEPMDSILTAGKSKCTVYMRIRALSLFMGFIDDVFVNLECFQERPPSGQAGPPSFLLLSVQSQLRLGKGDLGVNGRRVQRLYDSVKRRLATAEEGDCTKRLGTMAT